MKSIIKSIILFGVFAFSFVSCETYSDPKVDYSPIYPISGEWKVRITNLSTNALVANSMYILSTYNTADNADNQIWIRMTSAIPTFSPLAVKTVKVKISCNVPALSFSTTGITQNLHVTTNVVVDTVAITEGSIKLKSVDVPSGVKSDRISFKITKTKAPGVTYLVEGYRRTQWDEDEAFITFK